MDTRSVAAGDPIAHAAQIKTQEELLAAACEAMRLLQSRQQHAPEEHLDGGERRVLRQLRAAMLEQLRLLKEYELKVEVVSNPDPWVKPNDAPEE